MTGDVRSKLLPRNVAALRRFQDPAAAPSEVTGNPVMTRLESGIGNCFPGLECDLRNLERRFFPFLEIEIDFSVAQGVMQVSAVDLPGVEDAASKGNLSAADAASYRTISQDLRNGANWVVGNIAGDFGPFKQQSFNPDALTGLSFGDQRLPPEPWAAVRTLVEGKPVTLALVRNPSGVEALDELRQGRRRRVQADGAGPQEHQAQGSPHLEHRRQAVEAARYRRKAQRQQGLCDRPEAAGHAVRGDQGVSGVRRHGQEL
jgi:hypothetical protein